MERLRSGQINLAVGLLIIACFMLYGFFLIYLRDFAPDREAWVASYSSGKHFEARLAHVHGALFSVLNIVLGLVIRHMPSATRTRETIAILGLAGLLMPIGILAEVYLGLPPLLVIVGGIAIFAAFVTAGLAALRQPTTMKEDLQ